MSDESPTGLGGGRASVRPSDHHRLGDGATRDPESVAAMVEALRHRRADNVHTALVIRPGRRGYTKEDHDRAEALRGEAVSLRRIAAAKPHLDQRELVEQEAKNLEDDAEQIVPIRHAREHPRP